MEAPKQFDNGLQHPARGEQFEVSGGFLSRGGYPMRNWLDVVRRAAPRAAPDIMVIMMNPGSSGPSPDQLATRAGRDFGGGQEHRLARPDRTQLQIIRLMNAVGVNHARIINLSDLRASHSSDLVRFLASEDASMIDHSIFSPSREEELESLLERDVPVVYAWGVHASLLPLAKRAVDVLGARSALGLPKAGTAYAYYHPLPPVYSKQVSWVNKISAQFTRHHERNANSLAARRNGCPGGAAR